MELEQKINESLGEGLRRALLTGCDEAIRALSEATPDDPNNLHEIIHDLRKNFKKIRAQLRMTRYGLNFYKQENVIFRDWGRQIAPLRDASAKIEALDKLISWQQNNLYKNTFAGIRKHLEEKRQQLAIEQVSRDGILEKLEQELEEHRETISQLPLATLDHDSALKAVKLVYTRGREAMDSCRTNESTYEFHNWRKRAKYLRYQLITLKIIWPEMISVMENELHKLSDDLGDLHDLSLLTTDDSLLNGEDAEVELLKALVAQDEQRLIRSCRQLGEKFYVSKPSHWIYRLDSWHRTFVNNCTDRLPDTI